jgi:hypothetical protein
MEPREVLYLHSTLIALKTVIGRPPKKYGSYLINYHHTYSIIFYKKTSGPLGCLLHSVPSSWDQPLVIMTKEAHLFIFHITNNAWSNCYWFPFIRRIVLSYFAVTTSTNRSSLIRTRSEFTKTYDTNCQEKDISQTNSNIIHLHFLQFVMEPM